MAPLPPDTKWRTIKNVGQRIQIKQRGVLVKGNSLFGDSVFSVRQKKPR
jgi:hypothetical protein